MTEIDATSVIELANSLTVSGILLYLLISERRGHDETRRAYRSDLMKLIQEMKQILEEIAGIKANMWTVQRYRSEADTRPRSDTRPLPMIQSDE